LQIIGQIFAFDGGGYTLVPGSTPQELEIWLQDSRNITLSVWYWHIYRRLFRFVTMHAFDRETDWQTNGQTERRQQ